jgi:flagellar hook-associated protein 1 FlgK
MSGLGTALNTALSALQANQIGLTVVSNNIANVNTPGYSRQRVLMQESPSIGDSIRVGTGVTVVGTEAIRDQIVERRLWSETSAKAGSDMSQQSLSDIEGLFNEAGNTGLLPLISNFYNSFQNLSTNPTSPDMRQQVVSSAQSLTQYINTRANDLRDMKTAADQGIKDDIAKANVLINQIADISQRIHEVEIQAPANDLRDQRTVLVKQLSEIMNVRELDSNGTYQLTTGNGRPLVVAGAAVPLKTGTTAGGLTTVMSDTTDITSEITGGTIAARVAFRDQSIPQYQQQLDQMAYDLANQINQVHSVSYDPDGNTGVNFFMPIAATAGAALNLQLNPAIATDPRKIAASSQASGDGNDAAIAMGNLVNASNPPRGTVIEQYRSLVFQIGSETATAQASSDEHASMLTQLENLRSSISGVSINEETTDIIQFQRAFQASAKIVSVVDELLQTTLAMGTVA